MAETTASAVNPSSNDRLPKHIWYIIGNEAAERFSYYGMRNILTVFLIGHLLLDVPEAERSAVARSNFHIFAMGVYLFPLLGGYLADRFWGKYRTILWLSLLYCVGHACLAIFENNKAGFYGGLFLIALGAGGIKPCVSAFVGDQFTESNKHLTKKIFGIFYWSINFGSLFASLCIPLVLDIVGPSWAFGVPGILMGLATFIFWLGRKHYTEVPATGRDPHSFLRVVWTALQNRTKAKGHWLDGALTKHPASDVEGAKSVFRVLAIFAMIPIFWALFDQKASLWVVQGLSMDAPMLPILDRPMAASQMQALNPLMVMILIPLTQVFIYPGFERMGFTLTPLRRITFGMFIAGASYVLVALIQMALDGGNKLNLLWQTAPYLVLTLSEVLVSTTGLEFAYSQAPTKMKGTIMSFWNLTVFFGNLLVAVIARLNVFTGATTYFFYAGLIFVAGVLFWIISRNYKTVDYFRKSAPTHAVTAPDEHKMTAPKPASGQ